jgi:hypothetical protein
MSKTQIPTNGLADNAVVTGKITDGTIATGDIADDAVTAAKATGFGKIGQVVYGSTTSNVLIESSGGTSSFADTGLTLNITPSATSSKVNIFITIMGVQTANGTNSRIDFKLMRDSTELVNYQANMWQQSSNEPFRNGGFGITHQDSPNSTSQITYKLQFRAVDGDSNVQRDSNSGSSAITAMEVLA